MNFWTFQETNRILSPKPLHSGACVTGQWGHRAVTLT